ncbi:putative phage tail protein [Neisseria meningitidis]|uniref:putative phage tail protein n=1 Tax=Neisseria meningitidis TaxID=487 RepID=UPI000E58B643
MSYQDILRGLLPPVSYARNAPRVRAQAEIDGAALDAVAESAQSVADAVDPRSAGQMLADWERVLGLDGTGKNRQRRVLAVMAKLNETGGLSIPYFVRLAEAAGYQIQIDEPQPFRAGVNRAGDRLAPQEIMWVWHVNVRGGNNHDIFHKANKPRFAEDIEGKPNTLSGYGIGNFKVETFRGDLNTLKTDGIYSLPTAVGSSNLPVENTACHIQVIAGTKHGWCRQLGYPAYTSDVYERHQTSSANDNWSAWKKLNSDGIPVGAIVSFPKAVQNPAGYLKANGTTFAQNTFPDLYRALGNSNRLPDLSRTDIGITAWFPSDQIPTGWLAFDDIRTRVTETAYPELYRLLTGKYGSIQNVPQAEDRFIRNAGNGLAVGTKQEDEIKRHVHKVFSHWTNHTDAAAVGYEDHNERQRSALVSTWTDGDLNDNGFLTPRLDSKMATGGAENRPKALVLKLCIKAADTLGEAVFWIKSHGETINAGALDAGTLAQNLQDKADRAHTHTAAQIQGLDEKISTAVAAQFTRQTIGGVDIVRFPDGTMIQTGSYRFTRSGGPIENEVVFPVAFADGNVKCFVSERHSGRVTGDRRQHNWLFIRAKNHAAAIITNWYEGSCDWMAIGKAASGNAASSPIGPEIPETNEEPQRESGRTSTGPRNRRRHRDGLLEALQD